MERRSMLAMVGVVGLTVLAGGVALAAASAVSGMGSGQVVITDVEFPAAAIRTAKTPPAFTLQDQHGETVTLEALRGKVVVLTAVYATCHAACPSIITQAKSAVNKLTPQQRADIAIVAITLDPEGDDQVRRAATAKAHNLEAPLFRYVNGEDPEAVLALVEELGWARAVAGDTGVIGHSNLFLLVDRAGKIAYTISADTENDWLEQGLRTLLAES